MDFNLQAYLSLILRAFGTMAAQLREGKWAKQLYEAAIFGEVDLFGLAGAHKAG